MKSAQEEQRLPGTVLDADLEEIITMVPDWSMRSLALAQKMSIYRTGVRNMFDLQILCCDVIEERSIHVGDKHGTLARIKVNLLEMWEKEVWPPISSDAIIYTILCGASLS
jgi:hypothetical protein